MSGDSRCGGESMLASKIAKSQSNAPEPSACTLPGPGANLASRRLALDAAERVLMVQRTIGNQATMRLLRQEGGLLQRQPKDPQSKDAPPKDAQVQKAHADAAKRDLCIAQPVDESRARCKFTSEQEIMVRVVQQYASRVCSKAIAAVNMPGNEEQVKRIAQEYFGLKIKLSDKTRRTLVSAIRSVHDKLEGSDIQCATCQEDRCNTWGAIAFVDDDRTHMGLCPRFFNSRLHKPYLTPRFLIHESGHLARLDQNSSIREEFYCDMGKPTEEEKCPVPDAIHNVDAWSHFIEDLAATI